MMCYTPQEKNTLRALGGPHSLHLKTSLINAHLCLRKGGKRKIIYPSSFTSATSLVQSTDFS